MNDDLTTRALFRPCAFGSLRLRNRVVMAPMNHLPGPKGPLPVAVDKGVPRPEWVDYYRARARMEVGLIISGGTLVESRYAFHAPSCTRFESPQHLEAWARIVGAIHAEGGAFAPQLWHMGYSADAPIGPSVAPPRTDANGCVVKPPAREMDRDDMREAAEAFAAAAGRAREIGCDAVEIHGAHGFLLDTFVDPAVNARTDDYGGTLENRLRFPVEVIHTVRRRVGPDYPVIFRFNNRFAGIDECRFFARSMAQAGVSILHLSSGDVLEAALEEAGTQTMAGMFRQMSGIPLIGVGGVTRFRKSEEGSKMCCRKPTDPSPAIALVECGEIDLLAVGAALLGNADWVIKVRRGQWATLERYAFA